jgi:hypothetical protein
MKIIENILQKYGCSTGSGSNPLAEAAEFLAKSENDK